MADDDSGHEAPTRREYVKYGGAVIGGGLFAGCPSDARGSASTSNDTEAETAAATGTATTTETPATTETDAPDDGSYSVTMAPMGTVTFEAVPRDVLASSTVEIDIAAALGHGAAVKSTSRPSSSVPSLEFYYSALDTSNDWIDFREAGNFSKETLYELDSDVHFLDPAYVSSLDGWSGSDIDEVAGTVGPFFGNMYSRKHRRPPESWRDSYRYYTLWELTEKYAAVLRERDRFERLHEVKEGLLRHVRSKLPSPDDRPTVGMVYPRLSEDAFYVHKLNQPGYFFAHTRPLDAVDVFADIETGEYGGKLVDYEAMLDADPDVVIMNHGISSYYDVADAKASIRDHGVGSELAAVRNDRLYASGNPRQGPLMNLFQLEMTAKQFYPERFGEWPGYVDGEAYPDIPAEERLFDRGVVADIVDGEF
ncbi:ABC transporter substrate-binding protein [Halosimplex rubrum]|uniref:ABC transporter substrate-binding protein n=1 Tax=Halosimplex rubrum TaxID=869889 RepID=A0A7D5NXS6_9EURY|nr:ABC transporter substrate-binding protein [Halosimplex rubrum]QLH75946.1 ABC transporter substrate-binding protein [Halosimplex rubrum]